MKDDTIVNLVQSDLPEHIEKTTLLFEQFTEILNDKLIQPITDIGPPNVDFILYVNTKECNLLSSSIDNTKILSAIKLIHQLKELEIESEKKSNPNKIH